MAGRAVQATGLSILSGTKAKAEEFKRSDTLVVSCRAAYPFTTPLAKNLNRVVVTGCSLRQFETRFLRCHALTHLELRDNDFSRHGGRMVFSTLPGLQVLNLANNRLPDLPLAFWAGLPVGLVSLNLSENKVSQIPNGALRRLTRLRALDLSSNCLRFFSSEIGTMEGLQRLDVSKNELTSVPGTLVWLKRLQHLDFSSQRHGNEGVPGPVSVSSVLPSATSLKFAAGLAVVRNRFVFYSVFRVFLIFFCV